MPFNKETTPRTKTKQKQTNSSNTVLLSFENIQIYINIFNSDMKQIKYFILEI